MDVSSARRITKPDTNPCQHADLSEDLARHIAHNPGRARRGRRAFTSATTAKSSMAIAPGRSMSHSIVNLVLVWEMRRP